MSELDTLNVHNPLKEEFKVRFNGEPYSVPAKGDKTFPQFLAFHVARHLSDQLLAPKLKKLQDAKSESPFKPEITQLTMHDNVDRRKALYQILGNKDYVSQCIAAFPFHSFVGEMSEYDDWVEKQKTSPKDAEETE